LRELGNHPRWKKFGSGMEKFRIRDPGSGINIPDPQHCSRECIVLYNLLITGKERKTSVLENLFLQIIALSNEQLNWI
jgi:hypothetical protein